MIFAHSIYLASFLFLVNKTASVLSTSKLILFCRSYCIASSLAVFSVFVVFYIELFIAIILILLVNDKKFFSIFDIIIMKEMISFISINNFLYIIISRFKLNKMISFDEMSLYKFVTLNFKLIMIIKTDFFTQFYNIIKFREKLSFKFIMNNIE